jgi:hypothetical protein
MINFDYLWDYFKRKNCNKNLLKKCLAIKVISMVKICKKVALEDKSKKAV